MEPPRHSKTSSEVQAHQGILRTSTGRHHLVVEVPSPLPLRDDIPVHTGLDHALLRPYEKVARHGNPITGSVQYHLTRILGEFWPRVLFAVTVREEGPQTDPRLLPGNVFIFPGFEAGRKHHIHGRRFFIHHLSIREKSNSQVEVYAHARRADGAGTERPGEPRPIEGSDSMIHVGQLWIKRREALDQAGLAFAPLTFGGTRSMEDRKEFFPNPLVRNHGLHDLQYDSEIVQHPNYLWVGFFLSRVFPSEDQQRALTYLLHMEVPRKTSKPPAPDFDEQTEVFWKSAATDLSRLGASCEYRYLFAIFGIVPGQMNTDTSLAAFAQGFPL